MKKIFAIAAIVIASCSLYGCGPSVVTTRYDEPVYERPIRPYPNYVWVDGDWYMRNGTYTYRQGYWAPPRAHRVWHGGSWQTRKGGYYWRRGRWR